jgi:predicted nucleic acid-binding protein
VPADSARRAPLSLLCQSLRRHPLVQGAAELWAQARSRGTPTADPKGIDADVILTAQALSVGATVATENVGHLAQFVEARPWQEITAGR